MLATPLAAPKCLMREAAILHRCMLALSEAGCTVFRAQVGTFWTADGRPVRIGVPGHSDLYGFRPDGRMFFVETKSERGTLSADQKNFLQRMRSRGAVAVVARDPDDCVRLVLGNSHQ